MIAGPFEELYPPTNPELPVAVQEKVVKGREAARTMFIGVPEQMVELAAFVTVGLGLTMTFRTVGEGAVQTVPLM